MAGGKTEPSKGTDYKSAPAAVKSNLCELGEAKWRELQPFWWRLKGFV